MSSPQKNLPFKLVLQKKNNKNKLVLQSPSHIFPFYSFIFQLYLTISEMHIFYLFVCLVNVYYVNVPPPEIYAIFKYTVTSISNLLHIVWNVVHMQYSCVLPVQAQ